MRPLSSPALILCCACAVACAGVTASYGDFREHAWSFVGTSAAWSVFAGIAAWQSRKLNVLPWAVLGTAVTLRLMLIGTPPTLSDDLYRYLWEGRIQWAGFNPFLYPPGHPDLAPLGGDLLGQVTYPDIPTIYPPLAQWLFALVALFNSSLAWKALVAAADLGIVCLLGGTGRIWAAVLWALHPLPVVESAISGHLEAIAILLTLSALARFERGDSSRASLLATLGGGVKLLPAVLVPVLIRGRTRQEATKIVLVCIAVAGVVSLPYLGAGAELARGLRTYARYWSHNASFFSGLLWLTGDPLHARRAGAVIGLGIALWAWRQRLSPGSFLLCVSAALVLLSPVVHPWYVLWPLAAGLWVGSWPWAVLASTCLLSYGVLQGYDPSTGGWEAQSWIPWVEYPPLLLALLAAHWKRSASSAPAAA